MWPLVHMKETHIAYFGSEDTKGFKVLVLRAVQYSAMHFTC